MAKKSNDGIGSISGNVTGEPDDDSSIADPHAGNSGGNGGGSDEAGAGSAEKSHERIAGLGVADPATAGSGTDGAEYTGGINKDGTPTRKRGRKPGSGKGSTKTTKPGNRVNGLEKLLFSLHMMAAAATKTPELSIDTKESEMLASAISAVQEHYDFDVSEEVTLWVNLVTAATAVYGPRVVLIYSRKQRERKEKRPSATVVDINAGKSQVPQGLNIPGMHDTTVQ